ncbi:MAG: DUF4874 domain-containing protein [Roseburia sp.]|nr:DUF4874 domain-containing protein [Roseburia sp.]
MKFIISKRRNLLLAPVFQERLAPVYNPGRGWYHIYTYELGSSEDFLLPVCYENETIALVLLDIGFYSERALDEAALEAVQQIFSCFAEQKLEMIVRITYDTKGRGMEREPSSFSLVQQHMRQLAPLLLENKEHILVHQGLFIGSWGEMHSSKYLTKGHLKQLTALFQKETQGLVRLAFRRPVQYRQVKGKLPGTKEIFVGKGKACIGFYNDAMLASKSHMGTFAEGECPQPGWEEPWSSEEEVKFMAPLSAKVPMGGEVVWAYRPLKASETIRQLRELQVSYLNCVHDEKRLNQWKETLWEGVSLYDYIGLRLGYCYVLRECRLQDGGRKGFCLELEIENIGFACGCEPVSFFLYLKDDTNHVRQLELFGSPELCELPGSEKGKFVFPIKGVSLKEKEALYLQIKRSRDGREIFFANPYTEDKLYLGSVRR